MSTRSFADGRKLIGKNTSAKSRLDAAILAGMEPLEQRQMLNAVVLTAGPNQSPSGSTPLPPQAGVTFYVNGQGTSNAWQWNSAITPNTVNDLVLNVTAYNQNFTGCCEGTNSAVGNTGSINGGRLLTNGLTQNQVGGFPASGAVAATGSGNISDASSGESVVSQVNNTWWLEYNLGSAPGQTPSSTGYDISELDMIAGHQDFRTGMQADVLVQYVGSSDTSDWFSLSNNADFSYTTPSRGAAQMAIQNNAGGAMAKNVRAVKFFAANDGTWYREFVVTGTPSTTNPLPVTAIPAPVASADPTPGAIDVTFNLPSSGAQSYLIQRALVTNGVPGAFATVGSTVSTNNPTVFVDGTGAAGAVYVYQIIGVSTAGNATSPISNQFATPLIGAEAHYYNMAYWEGPVTVSQGVAVVQLNWPGGSQATGIRLSVNSAAITGKVTTNAAGVYTFYSNTDDDGYLYLNGVLVSADPGGHGQRNAGSALDVNGNPIGFATPIQLAANTAYDFVLLEHNSAGGAGANLVWTTPSSPTTSAVVPSTSLSPISDTPLAPTGLTVTSSNANFVNFTFTAENNAVVHYILQRAIAGTSNWATVDQIDPGSDATIKSGGVITSQSPRLLTIQDAQPLPGVSYIYRVAALNYDGSAATPAVGSTLTQVADLVSPPVATVTLGTAVDATGIVAGTYYVKYAWLNSAGGTTAASAEQTITTTGVGDITVALPAAPAGAASANVYLSSVTGQERLVGNAIGGHTVTVKGLPLTAAVAAPSTDTAGLAAGTYFVAYTWVGDNTTTTGESSYSIISNSTRLVITDETSIILSATNDITISGFPAAPTGVGAVNVYVGTSLGGERLAGTISPTGSLTVNALPFSTAPAVPAALVNNTALVSNTATTLVPTHTGVQTAGVEIHMYNQELFRRTSGLSSIVDASGVAQNGLATEYVAQTTVQSIVPGLLAGPIDRDYGAIVPSIIPAPAPSTPDPTPFPDITRIHTESFAQVFTGSLTPSVSGVYTIITNTDDDGYAWLDGTLISADPGGHGQQTTSPAARSQDTLVPVTLTAGQSYNLTMFMGNTGGGSGAHLTWIEPAPNGSVPNGTVATAGTSNTGEFGATVSLAGNSFVNQNSYNNYTIFITSGPGAGQAGIITAFNSTTRVATVNVITNGNNLLWSTLPTASSGFYVAWVAPVPLKGGDGYSPGGNQGQGGLSLFQDVPSEGVWANPASSGTVNVTTSASAAENISITQVSPTAGVSLSWTDMGLDELWYEVQRSTNGTTWSTIGTTPMNVGTTFTDTTGTNAFNSPTISYFYRVRGVNFDGAGPFSTVVNTDAITINAPNIVNVIQGAPGTAGLVMSGGSQNAGGLDIQYATVTGGTTTGAFVDATPLGLPFNTFDYQVTGLTASQPYVFKLRNLPNANYTNSTLFSSPVGFTPSGGVQEAFGTPGTGVGGFTGAGDLLVNTNSSLTGAGIPSPATPASAPNLTSPSDLSNPVAFATVTINADAPAPTDAGSFTTAPNNLGLSNAATIFLEYTWVTGTGETLPFSTPVSFSIPSGTGVNLTYSVPTAPAGFNIVNANIYMGTSTVPTAELLKATVAPGTTTIIGSLATGKAVPTASTAGIPAGTYYLKYTWTNSANQQTAGSTEQTIVATNSSNDLIIGLPTAPALATNSSVYISTAPNAAPGSEHLIGSAGIGATPTITIRGLPATTTATPPATNAAGFAAGTYYVQYTWLSTEPNITGESLTSPMASIVVTAGQDVSVSIPVTPAAGNGNANVYIGSSLPVPSPVAAPAVSTAADAAGLPVGTYYVKYAWQSGSVTTNSSPEQTVVLAAASDVLVSIPATPVGAGNANVYISTNSGGEKLAASVAGGTQATITALPATSAASTPTSNLTGIFIAGQAAPNTLFLAHSTPTSGNRPSIPGTVGTGPVTITTAADVLVSPPATPLSNVVTQGDSGTALAIGTYYLEYTWLGTGGGETAHSAEQTVTVGSANGDILLQVPNSPTGAGNANIYIGTASGAEQLLTQVAGNNSAQITLKTLPATNAVVAPTVSTVGVPAGTYYLEYTWIGTDNAETVGSPEQTFTAAAGSDIMVAVPTNPIGSGNARIYLGTVSGQEFYTGQNVGAGQTATIKSLPTIDQKIVPAPRASNPVGDSQGYQLFTPANALQVTNNNGNQAGNSFNLGENIAGFTTSFDFMLTGNTSADGLGIVFQPDARTFTGGAGGAMDYNSTTPSMQHSVGIFFNTYDGAGANANGTGIGTNGGTPGTWISMTSQNGAPSGVVVTNGTMQDRRYGDAFNVTLNYNNTTHIITENVYDITLKNRGINNGFSTSYSIDLVAAIGMPAAYVGFVGGTGGAQAEHDILNWTWSNSTTIPLDTITGTAGVDQITLSKDTDGTDIDWTLNGGPQVFTTPINDPNGLTINGNGANDVITLNYANGNPLPNKLNLNGRFTVNGLQGTNPLAGTNVDIGTSTVFIPYGSPAADPMALIQGYLQNGYSGNTWTGTATPTTGVIKSSAAAINPNNFAVGYADSADAGNPANIAASNTIEIRYAGVGDTNLNDTVDINDYNAVVRNFGTGTKWDQGNVTYDNTVSINDYNAIVRHFGNVVTAQSPTPAAAPAVTPTATPAVPSTKTAKSSLANTTASVTLSAASSSSTGTADTSVTGLKKKHKKHK